MAHDMKPTPQLFAHCLLHPPTHFKRTDLSIDNDGEPVWFLYLRWDQLIRFPKRESCDPVMDTRGFPPFNPMRGRPFDKWQKKRLSKHLIYFERDFKKVWITGDRWWFEWGEKQITLVESY